MFDKLMLTSFVVITAVITAILVQLRFGSSPFWVRLIVTVIFGTAITHVLAGLV